jgi:hypothetical protein
MRLPDWERRLEAYLQSTAAESLRYGTHDCGLFACGAIAALTGRDVGAWLRGRYQDRKAAAEVLQTFAGGGVLAAARRIAEENGFAEIMPLLAQRGDVVAMMTARGAALGVVGIDGHVRCFDRFGRHTSVPLTHAFCAWRIA